MKSTNMLIGAGARGYVGYFVSSVGPQSTIEGVVLSNAISGGFGAFSANWYTAPSAQH